MLKKILTEYGERQIIEIINNIRYNEKINIDVEYVSLYDVAELIKRKHVEYRTKEKYIVKCLNNSEDSTFLKSSHFSIDFDYDFRELIISLYKTDNYEKIESIIFTKKDGILCIKGFQSHIAKFILNKYNDFLSELYDILNYFALINHGYHLKPLDSDLSIEFNEHRVDLIIYDQISKFYLLSYIFSSNKYLCSINNHNIINALSEISPLIFYKTYVKIVDCPECNREDLYQIRQKQLKEKTYFYYKNQNRTN